MCRIKSFDFISKYYNFLIFLNHKFKLRINIFIKYKNLLLYVLNRVYRLIGKDWNAFYSWSLNRIEKKNSFKKIKAQNRVHGFYSLKVGEDLRDVLIEDGLSKENTFLDFGCGYGRIAIPIIKYLDSNKYVGLDLSEERIRLAKEYVEDQKLNNKKPLFLTNINKTPAELLKRKFDVILIYTVIGHNPIKEVENIINSLVPYLEKNGSIYFDYANPSNEDHYMTVLGFKIKLSVKDYRHTDNEIHKILNNLKLNYTFIENKEKKGFKWKLNKELDTNRKFIKAYHK